MLSLFLGIMKYYFIVNRQAGKDRQKKRLTDQIAAVLKEKGQAYTLYFTTGVGDATRYVKNVCQQEKGPKRFYACGGDGTLNEVVNGAVGYSEAEVGVIPCGTGNDFIKNFPEACFDSLSCQIEGQMQPVDLLRVNGRYCVNIDNIGFDADVAYNMNKFKKLGKMAYTLSILYCLMKPMGVELDIALDGRPLGKDKRLLCVMGNGLYYGGQYKGLPKAVVNDGLMDLCVVKKISRFRFLSMLHLYKEGLHADSQQFSDILQYYQAKKVSVTSKTPFSLSIDGEIFRETRVNVEIEPGALAFVVPQVKICEAMDYASLATVQ